MVGIRLLGRPMHPTAIRAARSRLILQRRIAERTLADLSPQGIATSKALPAGSWNCFEYHIGTDGTIETWLNNATIAGLTVKSGVSNPNAAQWQRSTLKPKITSVNFGWELYGGDADTFWFVGG